MSLEVAVHWTHFSVLLGTEKDRLFMLNLFFTGLVRGNQKVLKMYGKKIRRKLLKKWETDSSDSVPAGCTGKRVFFSER